MGAGYPPNPMTSPAASAVQGLNQGPPIKRSMKIEEVLKPTDPLCESMTLEEVKHWLKGYEAFMDQDVKASKVRVGLVRCRRLMVNENEALEAVADKVENGIDPIPKDESAIVINWRHGTLPMLVKTPQTLKITDDYYQRKKEQSSPVVTHILKFISRNRPLINWGG